MLLSHHVCNVAQQRFDVDKVQRSQIKRHRPCIVWFTGLSGAGKSTIMNLVEVSLSGLGMHTYSLDGDNLRDGLNCDLGFTKMDRIENIRRAGEVARLMVDAGLIVLCAFISPFRPERHRVRGLVRPEEFIEVFVDTPLDLCIARDPKGLYAKAKAGLVRHVTGIDAPYEPPEMPELRLETSQARAEELAARIVSYLERRGVLSL